MSETKSVIVELCIILMFVIGLCGVFFSNDVASILKWFCIVVVSLSINITHYGD